MFNAFLEEEQKNQPDAESKEAVEDLGSPGWDAMEVD